MMSDKSKEKLIDKIRKILSLSKNNPSQEEAVHAANVAKELMDKYNLAMLEINNAEKEDGIEDCAVYFGKGMMEPYTWFLAHTLANHFDCTLYYNEKYNAQYNKVKEYFVVGHTIDLEIFEYTYVYLRRVIETMLSGIRKLNKQTTKKYLTSYAYGITVEISSKLYQEKETKRKEQNTNIKSLTVRRKNEVNEYCKNVLGLSHVKGHKNSLDYSGYNQGQSDGKNITIRNGVKSDKGNSQPRLN